MIVVLMRITWLVLSNMRDSFHLTLGVISSAIVAWFSSDMLFGTAPVDKNSNVAWYRFPLYIPWLLWEIVQANLWVLY
ncbi:Na+/H+ antiporter subunit E, partial [Oceanidesulfovibrio marinus]